MEDSFPFWFSLGASMIIIGVVILTQEGLRVLRNTLIERKRAKLEAQFKAEDHCGRWHL